MLTKELSQRLEQQESDPFHCDVARQALEDALRFQLRHISQGLFADRLLRGISHSESQWWQQYVSGRDHTAAVEGDDPSAFLEDIWEKALEMDLPYVLLEDAAWAFQEVRATRFQRSVRLIQHCDPSDAAFKAFRDGFVRDVAMHRIPRVAPDDLKTLKLRIYGTEVFFWQEGRINRQLRDLGSSHRYWVAGCARIRNRLSRALVDLEEDGNDLPTQFVFGVAGPASAIGKVQFFDFERELAVSPWLEESPAYREDSRVVLRRSIPPRLPIDPLGHEIGHIMGDDIDRCRGFPSWEAVLRDDLCVYCRIPRSLGKIAYEFSEALMFAYKLVKWPGFFPPGEEPQGTHLVKLLERLCDDQLLTKTDRGQYYCPLFEEGRRWHLT